MFKLCDGLHVYSNVNMLLFLPRDLFILPKMDTLLVLRNIVKQERNMFYEELVLSLTISLRVVFVCVLILT